MFSFKPFDFVHCSLVLVVVETQTHNYFLILKVQKSTDRCLCVLTLICI